MKEPTSRSDGQNATDENDVNVSEVDETLLTKSKAYQEIMDQMEQFRRRRLEGSVVDKEHNMVCVTEIIAERQESILEKYSVRLFPKIANVSSALDSPDDDNDSSVNSDSDESCDGGQRNETRPVVVDLTLDDDKLIDEGGTSEHIDPAIGQEAGVRRSSPNISTAEAKRQKTESQSLAFLNFSPVYTAQGTHQQPFTWSDHSLQHTEEHHAEHHPILLPHETMAPLQCHNSLDNILNISVAQRETNELQVPSRNEYVAVTSATADQKSIVLPLMGDVPMPPQGTESTSLVQDTGGGAKYYYDQLMKQFRTCEFTIADHTPNHTHPTHGIGYPGFECIHCQGKNGTGRYFPSSLDHVPQEDTAKALHMHLMRCNSVPSDVKRCLATAKASRRLHHGGVDDDPEESFFRAISWSRARASSASSRAPEVDVTNDLPGAEETAVKQSATSLDISVALEIVRLASTLPEQRDVPTDDTKEQPVELLDATHDSQTLEGWLPVVHPSDHLLCSEFLYLLLAQLVSGSTANPQLAGQILIRCKHCETQGFAFRSASSIGTKASIDRLYDHFARDESCCHACPLATRMVLKALKEKDDSYAADPIIFVKVWERCGGSKVALDAMSPFHGSEVESEYGGESRTNGVSRKIPPKGSDGTRADRQEEVDDDSGNMYKVVSQARAIETDDGRYCCSACCIVPIHFRGDKSVFDEVSGLQHHLAFCKGHRADLRLLIDTVLDMFTEIDGFTFDTLTHPAFKGFVRALVGAEELENLFTGSIKSELLGSDSSALSRDAWLQFPLQTIRTDEARSALVRFALHRGGDVSFVENPRFKQYVRFLAPDYELPASDELSEDVKCRATARTQNSKRYFSK